LNKRFAFNPPAEAQEIFTNSFISDEDLELSINSLIKDFDFTSIKKMIKVLKRESDWGGVVPSEKELVEEFSNLIIKCYTVMSKTGEKSLRLSRRGFDVTVYDNGDINALYIVDELWWFSDKKQTGNYQ